MKELKKAFTIVELVIVIAVIAILAAVLVPTFSNMILSAKVSNDNQTVAALNVALTAASSQGSVSSEEDLRKAVDDVYGSGFYDSMQPESASYGYHFWYNTKSGMIELARTGDLAANATGAKYYQSRFDAKLGAAFVAEGVRGKLVADYVLLDRGGSAVADALKNFADVETADDYYGVIGKVKRLSSDKNDASLESAFYQALKQTVIVTDNGTFRFNAGASEIQFAPGIKTVSSVLYVYDEQADRIIKTHASADNPTAFLQEDALTLPESVERVDSYGLYFAADKDVTVGVPGAESDADVLNIFAGNATNAAIKTENKQYYIEDNQLFSGGSVVGELDTTHKVASFKIGVEGAETDGAVYSVALDKTGGRIKLYATDFVAEDGGSVVSDTRVTWEIAGKPADSSVTIDDNGVVTGLSAGETRISAVSVQNGNVTAEIALRVGVVSNQSSISFIGDNIEQINGVTRKITLNKDEAGEFGYEVTVVKNYPDIAVDDGYTVTSDNGNVKAENGRIVVMPGVKEFTITLKFNSYNVTQSFKFIVEEAMSQFECIEPAWPHIGEYLYKMGNGNDIDAGMLWRFTGLMTDNGLTPGDVDITFEAVSARDNAVLTNRVTREEALKAGGLQYYQSGTRIGFTGAGVVRITITASNEGYVLNSITVPVEILDGVNVVDYAGLKAGSDGNKMILRDIALESYDWRTSYVVDGATLYGNGFTLDGTSASRPANMQWHTLLSVNNAVVDNVNVIGQVFPEIDWHNQPYAGYTISLNGERCELHNSYAYGSRAPLYVNSSAYVYNTVLEGGVLANAVLETSDVTFEDVTTIQNVDSDSIQGGIDKDNIGVGLGLFVNEYSVSSIKITLKGQFRQYNWISTELAEEIKDAKYKALAQYLLDNADGFIHNVDGMDYVNAGIVFQGEASGSAALIDERTNKDALPYVQQTFDAVGMKATIYSISSSADVSGVMDSNEFSRVPGALVSKPRLSLDISGIDPVFSPEIEGSTLVVKLPADKSFTLVSGSLPLTATYYGRTLDASLVGLVDAGGVKIDSVTASFASERNIVFRAAITVSESYTPSGTLTSSPVTYCYEFNLNTVLDFDDSEIISYGTGEYFYVPVSSGCEKDYKTAAAILEGLKIKDYDPATGKYVETDYSSYTELPDRLTIVSFNGGAMSSANKYTLKASNNKLYIVSEGASDDKRSETMTVVMTYTGYNGVSKTFTMTYRFTSGTADKNI